MNPVSVIYFAEVMIAIPPIKTTFSQWITYRTWGTVTLDFPNKYVFASTLKNNVFCGGNNAKKNKMVAPWRTHHNDPYNLLRFTNGNSSNSLTDKTAQQFIQAQPKLFNRRVMISFCRLS
jgi:hypothetical protein